MCIKNENIHYHVNTAAGWLQTEGQATDMWDTKRNAGENVEAL